MTAALGAAGSPRVLTPAPEVRTGYFSRGAHCKMEMFAECPKRKLSGQQLQSINQVQAPRSRRPRPCWEGMCPGTLQTLRSEGPPVPQSRSTWEMQGSRIFTQQNDRGLPELK